MALPIVSLNMMRGGAVLIDLSDIFMTDFAQLGLGMVDRSRSSWAKVKGFHNNMELEVETTFTGMNRRSMPGQNDPVADHRGITVVIHYSLMRAPEFGYRPRMADDRVGHFLSANKDFGITDPDSNFVRMINRWRLEKANPRAKLSPPRKQIVWYVEDTVPIEYRPYVEEGFASGTRRSRRSASRTPSPSDGKRPAATTSTPRTRITARSAGSPATWAARCRACGPTPSPAK